MKEKQAAVVLVGQGAIGTALLQEHQNKLPDVTFHVLTSQHIENAHSNTQYHQVDYFDQQALQHVADSIGAEFEVQRLIICTGMLHEQDLAPEKSIRQLNDNLQRLLAVNSTLPIMICQAFYCFFSRQSPLLIAVLSARVGSTTDNKLGGWYSYRASKSALNMLLKTLSIELQRFNKQSIVLGLHPGTVDSHLSEPFKKNVAKDKLFSPAQSAEYLYSVLQRSNVNHSGQCLAWDGKVVLP